LNLPVAIAPVAVFAYNRPNHFQKTLAALSVNVLASRSDVFVYLDGPKTENDFAANKKIQEICNAANKFRSLTLVRRDRNFGLASSIISGVTELCDSHGRVIVIEDDLVTSPFFLNYMNDALDLYNNNDAVASIHGYVYPISAPLPETFFLRGADCWGWATWKRAWDHFEVDGKFLLSRLKELKLEDEFNFFGACWNLQMLEDQIAGRNNSWAIRWHASAFVKNMLTLYPGRSLVKNIGHDRSGTHCQTSEQYDSVISNVPIDLRSIPAHPSEVGFIEFQNFFLSISRNDSTSNSQKSIFLRFFNILERFVK
jgi:hypothetical protein